MGLAFRSIRACPDGAVDLVVGGMAASEDVVTSVDTTGPGATGAVLGAGEDGGYVEDAFGRTRVADRDVAVAAEVGAGGATVGADVELAVGFGVTGGIGATGELGGTGLVTGFVTVVLELPEAGGRELMTTFVVDVVPVGEGDPVAVPVAEPVVVLVAVLVAEPLVVLVVVLVAVLVAVLVPEEVAVLEEGELEEEVGADVEVVEGWVEVGHVG